MASVACTTVLGLDSDIVYSRIRRPSSSQARLHKNPGWISVPDISSSLLVLSMSSNADASLPGDPRQCDCPPHLFTIADFVRALIVLAEQGRREYYFSIVPLRWVSNRAAIVENPGAIDHICIDCLNAASSRTSHTVT